MKTVNEMKPTGFQNGTEHSMYYFYVNKMKQYFHSVISLSWTFIVIAALAFTTEGCKKDNLPIPSNLTQPPSTKSNVTLVRALLGNNIQQNLTADITGFNAVKIDPNLKNAWGLSFGPKDGIWIAANHTGRVVVYNSAGQPIGTPINIPLGTDLNGGSPSGMVYNDAAAFTIPTTAEKSKLIVATEDGNILAWSSGKTAVTVANNSASNTVYKGLAIGQNNGLYYLYATDFHNNKIDVYDQYFNLVSSSSLATMQFKDPDMPSNFAPFGIQNINDRLYVTYAMQKPPDNMDDQSGPGNGYIDIYSTDGFLLTRFASRGNLNSPWGLTVMPGNRTTILVGNFGDGHINAFDGNGVLLGQVLGQHKAIAIDGLWAIGYDPVNHDPNRLYFTAGPNREQDGVFGFLQKQ